MSDYEPSWAVCPGCGETYDDEGEYLYCLDCDPGGYD